MSMIAIDLHKVPERGNYIYSFWDDDNLPETRVHMAVFRSEYYDPHHPDVTLYDVAWLQPPPQEDTDDNQPAQTGPGEPSFDPQESEENTASAVPILLQSLHLEIPVDLNRYIRSVGGKSSQDDHLLRGLSEEQVQMLAGLSYLWSQKKGLHIRCSDAVSNCQRSFDHAAEHNEAQPLESRPTHTGKHPRPSIRGTRQTPPSASTPPDEGPAPPGSP